MALFLTGLWQRIFALISIQPAEQIRNIPDEATANQMLATLAEGGLTDAYLVRTEDEGLKISLGLFHFQQSWSLADENGDPERTRLGLRLTAANEIPVVSGLIDRFGVRRLAAEYVDTKLHALQNWCENHS